MNPHRYKATLLDVFLLNDRTKHFQFEAQGAPCLDFQPGQFISLELDLNGQKYVRPYSIASACRPDSRFDLCLNLVPGGIVSRWLFDLDPGSTIGFTAPFGFFTLRQPPGPVSAFIATGTGIAPIRAMLQYLQRQPISAEVWLIFGVRTETDILYKREFESMAQQHRNFHFIPTLSRPEPGWTGHSGYVQAQIAEYLASSHGLQAYICGRRNMVDDVRQQLRGIGYERKALSYEKYD